MASFQPPSADTQQYMIQTIGKWNRLCSWVETNIKSARDIQLLEQKGLVGFFLENFELAAFVEDSRFAEAWAVCRRHALEIEKEKKKKIVTDPFSIQDLRRMQSGWVKEFDGKTLNTFAKVVSDAEDSFKDNNDDEFYAKVMPVVNSSGAGKSRLLDEYAKRRVGVIYTLRTDGETGFPPGDPEILNILLLARYDDTSSLEHARCVALLAATAQQVRETFEGLEEPKKPLFAAEFHRLMAPARMDITADSSIPVAERISTTRSEFRKMFCKRVAERSWEILERFKGNTTWLAIFDKKIVDYDDMATHQLVKTLLIQPMEALVAALLSYGVGFGEIPLFLVLDEIANLEGSQDQPDIPSAIRRVIRLFRHCKIWSFFLSTRKPLTYLAPSTAADRSWRISNEELLRIRPYFAFATSLGVKKRMAVSRAEELTKPLAEFNHVRHMAGFGRPLWAAYLSEAAADGAGSLQDVSGEVMRSKVIRKLLGKHSYDSEQQGQVLAILSARLTLSLCFNTASLSDLEERLIDWHLRWVKDIHSKSGYVTSATLQEPTVSEAATAVFCRNIQTSWSQSIKNMHEQSYSNGAVNRGNSGELVAQMILCMGRDHAFQGSKGGSVFLPKSPHHMKFAAAIKVEAFLAALFVDAHIILNSPATVNTGGGDSKDPTLKVAGVFEHAVINFTHFIDTAAELEGPNMLDFLHGLLMQQAAAQLKPGQDVLDLLIPVYRGDINAPFDPAQLAALAIQVKNRKGQSNFNTSKDTTRREFFQQKLGMIPVIAIMLDLGLESRLYKSNVSPNTSCYKTHFSFHVAGNGPKTFLPVTDGMEKVLRKILGVPGAEKVDDQAELSELNELFNAHSFSERFP